MKKKAKASRPRSAKKDLPARTTGGVKGGVERASTQILPYIEQTPGVNVAMADGSVRFVKNTISAGQ
jgi:prepilin-type processing-associated H-X9-DG protein